MAVVFFFFLLYYILLYEYIHLFIHSTIDDHLNCFQFLFVMILLAITNILGILMNRMYVHSLPRWTICMYVQLYLISSNGFLKWLYHFIFFPTVNKSSSCFTPSPKLGSAIF